MDKTNKTVRTILISIVVLVFVLGIILVVNQYNSKNNINPFNQSSEEKLNEAFSLEPRVNGDNLELWMSLEGEDTLPVVAFTLNITLSSGNGNPPTRATQVTPGSQLGVNNWSMPLNEIETVKEGEVNVKIGGLHIDTSRYVFKNSEPLMIATVPLADDNVSFTLQSEHSEVLDADVNKYHFYDTEKTTSLYNK